MDNLRDYQKDTIAAIQAYYATEPSLCRNNGISHAVRDYDAGRLTREELDRRYKQRKKEGRGVSWHTS